MSLMAMLIVLYINRYDRNLVVDSQLQTAYYVDELMSTLVHATKYTSAVPKWRNLFRTRLVPGSTRFSHRIISSYFTRAFGW